MAKEPTKQEMLKAMQAITDEMHDDLFLKMDEAMLNGKVLSLNKGESKRLGEMFTKVYKISHSHNYESDCYETHSDWRKEMNGKKKK